MAKQRTVPMGSVEEPMAEADIPDGALRTWRASQPTRDLLGVVFSVKTLAGAALLLVGWFGGTFTPLSETVAQFRVYMERSAPIIESWGRSVCLDTPQRAQRDGLPCDDLLRGAGYLTRPAASAADGTATFATRRAK